jgi:hypothetical protein
MRLNGKVQVTSKLSGAGTRDITASGAEDIEVFHGMRRKEHTLVAEQLMETHRAPFCGSSPAAIDMLLEKRPWCLP